MDQAAFEEKLGELIVKGQNEGLATEDIISALELAKYALQEEL